MADTTTTTTGTVAVTHGHVEESSCHQDRFTFGSTLRHTFGLLCEHLDKFAGLYAVTLPCFGVFIGLLVVSNIVRGKYPILDVVLSLLMLVVEVVWFAMGLIAAAAIIYATASVMSSPSGRMPSFGKAIKAARRRFCTLLASTILMAIPEAFLLTLITSMVWDPKDIEMCVIAVAIWTICGSLLLWMILGSTCLMPSVMVGHLAPLAAIKKSFGLARGNYLYILCLLFTVGTLEQGILALLQQLIGKNFLPLIYLQSALVVGPLLVLPALSSILATVIYIGLCRSKEGGFSSQDLARQLAKYDNNDNHGHEDVVANNTSQDEGTLQEPLLDSAAEV